MDRRTIHYKTLAKIRDHLQMYLERSQISIQQYHNPQYTRNREQQIAKGYQHLSLSIIKRKSITREYIKQNQVLKWMSR